MSKNIQEIINNFKSLLDDVGLNLNLFFKFSEWILGVISIIFVVLGYIRKRKKKHDKLKFEQRNDNGSTGYQAKNITVNNKE